MTLSTAELISEMEVRATRSSGKGGQHINKVSTRVEARLNIPNSKVLTGEEKARLMFLLKTKLSKAGLLSVVVDESRSQSFNKERAIEKLLELIEKNLRVPKTRFKTKVPKGKVQQRLEVKKSIGEKKKGRSKVLFSKEDY